MQEEKNVQEEIKEEVKEETAQASSEEVTQEDANVEETENVETNKEEKKSSKLFKKKRIEELEEEVAKLKEELAASKNAYFKAYADAENLKKRLQAEADKGKIYVHIDERITECEKEKWKIWNKMRDTDPEYALAMENADTAKVWQLENLFELQAEEIAIQACLVV